MPTATAALPQRKPAGRDDCCSRQERRKLRRARQKERWKRAKHAAAEERSPAVCTPAGRTTVCAVAMRKWATAAVLNATFSDFRNSLIRWTVSVQDDHIPCFYVAVAISIGVRPSTLRRKLTGITDFVDAVGVSSCADRMRAVIPGGIIVFHMPSGTALVFLHSGQAFSVPFGLAIAWAHSVRGTVAMVYTHFHYEAVVLPPAQNTFVAPEGWEDVIEPPTNYASLKWSGPVMCGAGTRNAPSAT